MPTLSAMRTLVEDLWFAARALWRCCHRERDYADEDDTHWDFAEVYPQISQITQILGLDWVGPGGAALAAFRVTRYERRTTSSDRAQAKITRHS